MGLIIRTAGAARTKQEIKRDFEYLLRLWESVRDMTLQSTGAVPRLRGRQPHQALDPRPLLPRTSTRSSSPASAAHTEAADFMRMLVAEPGQERHQVRGARAAVRALPDRAAAERHVQPVRDAALGRLPRHQPDRGAGRHRRQLRQGDARVLHRGDGAQHQPGGSRGDRPPAEAARPRRPHRHRLHRHGGAAQQPQGREPPEGSAAPRPRPHPGRAHQPLRPPGDVAPAPAHRRARGIDLAVPALPGHRHHPLDGIGGARRAARHSRTPSWRGRAQLAHRGDDRRRWRSTSSTTSAPSSPTWSAATACTIMVQASDSMQGANFAIEKGGGARWHRRGRSSGPSSTWSGASRARRARRSLRPRKPQGAGRARGRRPPLAAPAAARQARRPARRSRRPIAAANVREFAGNGEADGDADRACRCHREPQPRHDLAEPLDEPAGTGEQPSIAHGDSDRRGRPRATSEIARGDDGAAAAAGAVATGTRRRAIIPTSSQRRAGRGRAATVRGPLRIASPAQAPAVTAREPAPYAEPPL